MTIAELIKEEGRQEGRQQGRQEGLTEGLRKGETEGRLQGQLIGQIVTLKDLLGETVEVSSLQSLSRAELEKLAAELRSRFPQR